VKLRNSEESRKRKKLAKDEIEMLVTMFHDVFSQCSPIHETLIKVNYNVSYVRFFTFIQKMLITSFLLIFFLFFMIIVK